MTQSLGKLDISGKIYGSWKLAHFEPFRFFATHKSISIWASNYRNTLYFSIKAHNQCITWTSNCKNFYNCVTVTSCMYEGTVTRLYSFKLFFSLTSFNPHTLFLSPSPTLLYLTSQVLSVVFNPLSLNTCYRNRVWDRRGGKEIACGAVEIMYRWWFSLAWVRWVVVWRLVSGVMEIGMELWCLCVVGVELWKLSWS